MSESFATMYGYTQEEVPATRLSCVIHALYLPGSNSMVGKIFPLSSRMFTMQFCNGMYAGSPTGDVSDTYTSCHPSVSVIRPDTTNLLAVLASITGSYCLMHAASSIIPKMTAMYLICRIVPEFKQPCEGEDGYADHGILVTVDLPVLQLEIY